MAPFEADVRDTRHPRRVRNGRSLGGLRDVVYRYDGRPDGITVSAAHSATHDSTLRHHDAGSSVRLQGGQSACEVSHVADYDESRRNVSNRPVFERRS